jgi:predicted phage baseplate assembly protein
MSNCVCEPFEHPPQLVIPAGLTHIPRQIAGFPEFRLAMLRAIRQYPALSHWRARGDDDFGIMLLEMWAYVADVQAFYDEVIAHEAYVRTARRRPSLRKLVALLGYIPRPAVAASVTLAVLAEGRQPIVLPAGLAFRSSAFDDEAPQVFELDAAATIHPLNNQWALEAPTPDTLGSGSDSDSDSDSTTTTQTFSQLLLITDTALKKDDLVLVQVGDSDSQTQVSTVTKVADIVAEDGRKYKQVDFSPALALPGNTNPVDVQVSRAAQTGSLWKISISGGIPVDFNIPSGTDPTDILAFKTALTGGLGESVIAGNPPTISDADIILDGLYRSISAGQYIILSKEGEYRWYKVTENQEVMMIISQATTTTVKDEKDKDVTVAVPAVTAPATKLVLDAAVNDESRKGDDADWDDGDATKITLHFGFVSGGTVTIAAQSAVAADDELVVSGPIEAPADGTTPAAFLVQDKNEEGYEVDASLNYSTGQITLGQNAGWTTPLVMPVSIYGSVVTASRGETVDNEILGSGSASVANQFFVLKKSPLTYTSAPTADNEQGVASSLKVYVDGILWNEVLSFYGVDPEAQVYIVRQNDDEASIVTFGDGRRGARLPTGSNNVTAFYRFGAGKAAPPAGGITQLAKPVKGLTAVKSPVAAKGGDDAETTDNLQDYAPESALLLGRAVSMADMEAVAIGVPGVRAVAVEWRWNQVQQRPVIQVWYIGDDNILTDVGQALRRLSDPTTPIGVEVALPHPLTLSIDVEIDERYLEDEVLPRMRAALMNSETGLLVPERIGIGRPLFRSRIFEAVMAVAGVSSVQGLLLKSEWIERPWSSYAIKPPAGKYFDFEQGGLLLNGKETDND